MYTSMFRKAMLGDTATLSLDLTQTLPTAVTFTRADTTPRATFTNASGFVQTVANAGDPRFDYSSTNIGEPRGLLIEASSTNYIKNSTTLSGTAWATGGIVTRTLAYATGPDGVALSATRLQMSHSSGTGRIYQDTGFTTKPYTNSIWVKSNTVNVNYTLNIWNTNGLGNANITVTPTWQRFVNVNTTGTSLAGFFYLENPSLNPAVVVDVLVYGAQLEAGSDASSYIPTGASQLTRLADDAVIRSTAWTSLYAQPGAIVVEFYRGAYGTGDRSILSTDPTATRLWNLKSANASATAQIAYSTGSATTQTGLTAGLNKVAIAWNLPSPTASFDLCVNGATPTFGGSNVGTTLSTWLTLGSKSTTGVSGTGTWDTYLNNSIKSVKYYPALTYAEMQAKTT